MMRIGILGSGQVAQTLGAGFLRHGHEVVLGTRDPSKLEAWAAEHPGGRIGSFAEAASFGEVVVLAVKGSIAADVLRAAGPANLSPHLRLHAGAGDAARRRVGHAPALPRHARRGRVVVLPGRPPGRLRLVGGGDTLTLRPKGTDPCAIRSLVWTGQWSRVR
jgi:NADP oxidoreductase coenzyme F420-dependent